MYTFHIKEIIIVLRQTKYEFLLIIRQYENIGDILKLCIKVEGLTEEILYKKVCKVKV